MSTTGERVRQRRKELGWSQAELANRANRHGMKYTQTTVAKTERGARPFSVEEAVIISRILGASMNWLATGTADDIKGPYAEGYAAGRADGIAAAQESLRKLATEEDHA